MKKVSEPIEVVKETEGSVVKQDSVVANDVAKEDDGSNYSEDAYQASEAVAAPAETSKPEEQIVEEQ